MKFFKVIFFPLLVILILSAAFQFVLQTRYTFQEPVIFKGEKLYNPYQGMDSTKWKMVNFHLHTKLLFGLTAGGSNSIQVADSFYKYFNYDLYGISDYMRINSFNHDKEAFIPVYEHGYQYYKTHQLVINASKVSWNDYFFYQTLNNKQYIINKLKNDTAVLVAIVHPRFRGAYQTSDFKYLGNYDFLEIANSKYSFINYLDTVLSAGHSVFLLAGDDAHDLSNISDGAHSFNVINGDLEKGSIIQALKKGMSYGVNLNLRTCKTNYEKKSAIQSLPVLKQVNIENNNLLVRMNKNVDTIKFIGQNGIIKKISINSNTGSYMFSEEDTYIRIEIVCNDGSVYYLNPVFRYDGYHLPVNIPVVNVIKTWTYRILFVSILFLIILSGIKYRKYISEREI